MWVGDARVSTGDHHLTRQQEAFTNAGCERVFTAVASGAQTARKGLEAALHC